MKLNKPGSFLISLLIVVFFAFLYSLNSGEDYEKTIFILDRVIDGDTIVTDGGITIRLVNINSPEKDNPAYAASMNYLKEFEGKKLEAEIIGEDKYGRTLARIYSEEYINLELVKIGFASKFLVQENELKIFDDAENLAIAEERGIWKKSNYYGCFGIDLDEKEEVLTIINSCEKIDLRGWTLKDESRKIYDFQSDISKKIILHSSNGLDNSTDFYWNVGTVWNDDRDSVYIFDQEGKISYHESYGY